MKGVRKPSCVQFAGLLVLLVYMARATYGTYAYYMNNHRQLGAIQPIRRLEDIVRLLGPPPYSYHYNADCPICDKAVWDPVCGSDYRTYRNGECLRSLACRRRRDLAIEHIGPCTHKAAILGRSPRSITRTNARHKLKGPELAPVVCTPCSYNLFQPLCGSDGKTYPNWMCLRHAACKQRKNIQVINPGPCGVGFLKGPYKQTANFFTGIQSHIPECLECNPHVGKPVCGSDGRTYANEKCLKMAACQNEAKNVRTVAPGPCKFSFNAISTTPTKKELSAVSITIECPAICTEEEKYICASDGISYPNDCLMRMEACLFKKALQVQTEGKCTDENGIVIENGNGDEDDREEEDDTIVDKTSSNGNDASEGQETKSVSPTDEDSEVEGDEEGEEEEEDEVTTTTTTTTTSKPTTTIPEGEVKVKKRSRQQREQKRQQHLEQQQKQIEQPSSKISKSASKKNSSGPKRKHHRKNSRHTKKYNKQHQLKLRRSSDGGVCPVCTRDLDWVCGTDGFTYVNPCSMRHESCIQRKAIFVKRPGRC